MQRTTFSSGGLTVRVFTDRSHGHGRWMAEHMTGIAVTPVYEPESVQHDSNMHIGRLLDQAGRAVVVMRGDEIVAAAIVVTVLRGQFLRSLEACGARFGDQYLAEMVSTDRTATDVLMNALRGGILRPRRNRGRAERPMWICLRQKGGAEEMLALAGKVAEARGSFQPTPGEEASVFICRPKTRRERGSSSTVELPRGAQMTVGLAGTVAA